MTDVLAIDMGSSSVRGYVGQTKPDGEVVVTEVFRHHHQAGKTPHGLVWDVNRLCDLAEQAAKAATDFLGFPPDSVAVDGWGVDFVPVDADGTPLTSAISYRDERCAKGRSLLAEHLDEDSGFRRSGVAPQDINSVNRIALYGHGLIPVPQETDCIMFLQDVVARHLATADIEGWAPGKDPGSWASTGVASTSGLLSHTHDRWDEEIREATRFDRKYLPALRPELTEICVRGKTRLLRAGSHDSACAAYGMEVESGDIFISCGSWAVVGAITDSALISDQAFSLGITNEAHVDGSNRAQLNLTGMWLSQECMRHWKSQGIDTNYEIVNQLTADAPSLGWVFDPQNEALDQPGNMPARIAALVREQRPDLVSTKDIDLNEPGTILRLIFESVAARIATGIKVLREEGRLNGQIRIAGGAVENEFFLRALQRAVDEELIICSKESTVIGNIRAQLKVLNQTP